MPRDKTTIEVGTDTWSALNQLKGPGDSFDTVLRRLLSLSGIGTKQPEGEEQYVSGDVVLARTEQRGDTVLKPSLIIREKRADEDGDYEVVHLSKLRWGSDSVEPRARAYLSENITTLSYNDDKIIRPESVGYLPDNE